LAGCSVVRAVGAARFDDPNLVSCAGLVPVMALAEQSGLLALADEHLGVPTDKGSNAGAKIGSLVAEMIAGADFHLGSEPGPPRRDGNPV